MTTSAGTSHDHSPGEGNEGTSDRERSSGKARLPIVALGALDGGLQALEAFFDSLPTNTGMAFVVLMHLSLDHESNLSEILRHHTKLKVRRIEDGMTPEPNVVYVLPSKTQLKIEEGQLRLIDRPPREEQRTVIDTFFRALAADQQGDAIGVILFGTGTDGTQGMKAIKEQGGFTMAQDPAEAEHDSMPRSAIETDLIDVVAPVKSLDAQLAAYWTHAIRAPVSESVEELPEDDEQAVLKILAQVYAGTGRDFSNYKRSTVMRCIARRLTVTHRSTLADYLELIRRDPDEVEALFKDLLISVTSFFRDADAFAVLEHDIIPKLFEGKDSDDQVRVETKDETEGGQSSDYVAQLEEELRSVNEELKTTNQELKTKIEELRRTNNDLQNLMKATDIATLFLDRQLRIQRSTPSVNELFNVRAPDIGCPLSDFSQQFQYDYLIADARSVLDSLQPVEKEFETDEGRWFLVRIRPYRTVDDKIDGVVLSFIDVTNLKEAHRDTEREREYAEDIVDTVWEPLLVLNEDLRVQSANDAFYKTFEVPAAETTGRLVYELGNGQWDIPELRTLLEEILPDKTIVTDYDVEHEFEHIGMRIMRLNARRIDEKQLILLAIEDITEHVEAVQQLKEERNFVDNVLDTVGALILVVDRDGRIIRFNKECEEVTDYSVEEVKGESVFERLIPLEEHADVRQVMEAHREGKDQTFFENHWITKEGERRLIRWSSTILKDEKGEVEHVIGTGIDITERRRLEREVVGVSDAERRRIGQDLHDLLASQLAGAAMMAQALARKLDSGEPVTPGAIRKVADLVRQSGAQARTLSHSLMPLEIQGDELMNGLQGLAERQEAMADVTCSCEAGNEVPTMSGEVASHLYRIAAEAVGNALKHADPNTITIRLDVEDDRLVLSVRDDGIGIPRDPKLTDGFGIHLMEYRAGLIDARLEIEPVEAGGTLVRCSLPL